ncbi:MAG: hypothetical protein P4L40_21635 [Terracidiphilus sp.]|nr:hypothetical protein [Terracidiphilus sp.]
MNDSNAGQERERLAQLYREKWDEELRELAATYADLTESAQQALREEMQRRGLGDPLAPLPRMVQHVPRQAAEGDSGQAGEEVEAEYTWKTPLCDCESTEQARQLAEALHRAGIESWIEGGSRYSWDLNGPRLLVAADQLEQAQQIAAQPIPQDIIDQTSELAAPEAFELPHCPRCGVPDPVLVDVDPVNRWQCESCGEEWADPAIPEPDSAKN